MAVDSETKTRSSGILLHPTSLPGVDRPAGTSKAKMVANLAAWTDRLRRFALPMLLSLRGQSALDQPGASGEGRIVDAR